MRDVSAHEVSRFLKGDAAAAPSLDALRATSLSGHAYARLPSHPERAALHRSYVTLAARHLAVRDALHALVQAWNQVGVVPLLFKGFHLAEFVYPSPGQRAYADVDVVIEPALATAALDTARGLGWEVEWRTDGPEDLLAVHGDEYTGHEVGRVRHPGVDVAIDLHRRAVHNDHNRVRPHPVAARLTSALLEASEAIDWSGAAVRVPCPADAVVFGLALNRCWGSDAWHVKPRDYADAEALVARHGLTSEAIAQRARELGVAGTVDTYLRRCDPTAGRLDVGRPSWWSLRRWNLRALPERGPRDGVRAWMAACEAVEASVALLRMLRVVRRAERALGSAGARPPSPGPGSPRRLTTRAWRTAHLAIERAAKLRARDVAGFDALTTLAGYDVLRRHGLDARIEEPSGGAEGGERPRLWLGDRSVDFPGRAHLTGDAAPVGLITRLSGWVSRSQDDTR